MGKRGQKPVDVIVLASREFEFYKAFHFLRDGKILHTQGTLPVGATVGDLKLIRKKLKAMSAVHYWLTGQRLAAEMGNDVNLRRRPLPIQIVIANEQKNAEVLLIDNELKTWKPSVLSRRRAIWSELVSARDVANVKNACLRWSRLRDVRKAGMHSFPRLVAQYSIEFLAMKANKRFQKSAYADDARIDYLSRGLAGVSMGYGPTTGIERLRNMLHTTGGPFWISSLEGFELPVEEQYCACWRCSMRSQIGIRQMAAPWQLDGLHIFMKFAERTVVPPEWELRAKELLR